MGGICRICSRYFVLLVLAGCFPENTTIIIIIILHPGCTSLLDPFGRSSSVRTKWLRYTKIECRPGPKVVQYNSVARVCRLLQDLLLESKWAWLRMFSKFLEKDQRSILIQHIVWIYSRSIFWVHVALGNGWKTPMFWLYVAPSTPISKPGRYRSSLWKLSQSPLARTCDASKLNVGWYKMEQVTIQCYNDNM